MSRKRLRRATPKSKPKSKPKAPKTVTLTAKQFRELLAAARRAGSPRVMPAGKTQMRMLREKVAAEAAPREKLTAKQMRERAEAAILGPMLADVRAGKMDPDALDFWRERRGEAIEQHIEDQKRTPRIPKCSDDCDRASTTVMAGKPYCTEHARLYKQEML